jgi:signal transduction histidine kinase/CheY-like chemotaxis protein
VPPTVPPAESEAAVVADAFDSIRADTLQILLVATAVVGWLVVLPDVGHTGRFWPGWGESVALWLLAAACYVVKGRSHRVAGYTLVAGLLAILGTGTLGRGGDAVNYLYVPVVLIAGALHGRRAAMLVALVASLSLAVRLGDLSVLLPALTVTWLSVLTSWLTTRNLYTALTWLWQSQVEATAHLEEARRHQGELAAALRQVEELAQRLERTVHSLNWARLDAEEARRVKAQFAAHVSHELRTPINLVVGFSDMMLNVPSAYGDAYLPPAYEKDLQALHSSSKHLQGLVDDILDLSQLDAREMPLMRAVVPVATVVDQAVSTVRALLERKRLGIAVDIDSEVTTFYVDPLRVRQVLLNLLTNACRHTSEGGVTVRARRQGESVAIAVADTGEGIPPDQVPYLFQAFHRLGSPVPSEGWGLGLAICRQFVELHGGTIQAASQGVPGEGAVFTVTLPAHAPIPAAEQPEGRPARSLVVAQSAAAPSAAVVVLDGDARVVGLYRRHLEGYVVHGAATEEEAVALVEELGAHALVVNSATLDDAADWHSRWGAYARRHGVRVVGCAVPSSHHLARAAGLADYLVKPVSRDALLDAVRTVCPGARTVAVIDDDARMVRMLGRMLHSAAQPYRVLRASGGEEGLALVRRARPDLVLLDLMMPDQRDGLALLAAMRADPRLAAIPVVAVTAQEPADVFEAPDARLLSLVSDQGLTVSEMLKEVRALLGALPAAAVHAPPPLPPLPPAPREALAASAAS